jgi:ABC-type methionine transport system permease subunit
MKKILCIVLLVLLVNCSTTTDTTKEQPNTPIDNIVNVLKNIPFPKF